VVLFLFLLAAQDGISFLNVPYWSDGATELYSVTLITDPCRPTLNTISKPLKIYQPLGN
jgi:hypothetical protein